MTAPTTAKYLEPVRAFKGSYRFLSNFYQAAVELDGVLYPTVEHAFQAAKTVDPFLRAHILSLPRPGQAKKAGRKVDLRLGWDTLKVDIMFGLLLQKFAQPDLRAKLMLTLGRQLEEGNDWHDVFWGICRGDCHLGPHLPYGENQLGKLLMKVRKELI